VRDRFHFNRRLVWNVICLSRSNELSDRLIVVGNERIRLPPRCEYPSDWYVQSATLVWLHFYFSSPNPKPQIFNENGIIRSFSLCHLRKHVPYQTLNLRIATEIARRYLTFHPYPRRGIQSRIQREKLGTRIWSTMARIKRTLVFFTIFQTRLRLFLSSSQHRNRRRLDFLIAGASTDIGL
jgi:hypothetical protein